MQQDSSPPSSPSLLTSTPQPQQLPIKRIVQPDLDSISTSPPLNKKAKRQLAFACKKEFECVVCYSVPQPTTHLLKTCAEEHIVCFACFKSLSSTTSQPPNCPLCKLSMDSTLKNIHVQSLLLDTQKVLLFNCVNEKCPKREMTCDESIAHSKVCRLKVLKCPRKNCNKTFLWLSGSPEGYCKDHVIVAKPQGNDEWDFAVYLNKLYSQDTDKVRQNKFFKYVLLLKTGKGFQGEAMDRLALKAFYYHNDLYFSLVCLDDSTFPLEVNKRLILKTDFFVSCHVIVGYGPFMKGQRVTATFQNQKSKKSNCLRLTTDFFSKFASKTRTHPCVECTNVDQHIHFRIQKVKT